MTRRSTDSVLNEKLSESEYLINSCMKQGDIYGMEEAVHTWMLFWGMVNHDLATAHRKENEDPETWELRYLRWMKEIKHIKCEGEWGMFYIVPAKPKKLPRHPNWFTVDELIEILGSESTMAAIKLFKALPIRSEVLGLPPKGEKHLHVRVGDGVVKEKFIFNWDLDVRNTVHTATKKLLKKEPSKLPDLLGE